MAFNLGKLVGLPGAVQLWPLAALWLAGAWKLLRELELWDNLATRRTVAIAGAVGIVALVAPPTVGAILMGASLNQPHGLTGRYYEGLRDSQFPPHILRVDRQVDFDSIVALGSLPYPSYATWTGRIIAPVTGNLSLRDHGGRRRMAQD